MNPVIIIKKKRDGQELSEKEISYIIESLSNKKLAEYQMSALLMAIYLNGLSAKETYFLTKYMLGSGHVIPAVDPLMVDKHSTGGVGDKASFVLAPIARACGVKVPMITGRGLGHTGGTVDKAESIPGLKMDLSQSEFSKQMQDNGLVICGQSDDIAPADRIIYALRDVTGTVESIPLITGSILSKKLAEGIKGLVLDIKVGSGAFCKTKSMARKLGKSLIKVAGKFDCKAMAILTNMEQPLGETIGNSIEMIEVVETLKGKGPKDLTDLSLELAAQMIVLAGVEKSAKKALKKAKEALSSGEALEEFDKWIVAQGGPEKFSSEPKKHVSVAPATTLFKAKTKGYISKMDTSALGMASLELGGGRKTKEDNINERVGIRIYKKIGDKIKAGDTILELIHEENQSSLAQEIIENSLNKQIKISKSKPTITPLFIEYLGL